MNYDLDDFCNDQAEDQAAMQEHNFDCEGAMQWLERNLEPF